MKLKRKKITEMPDTGTLVIDGQRVEEGYELPEDPVKTERELVRMEFDAQRRRESARTRPQRTLNAIAAGIRERKGRGFEWAFFGYALEFRRRPVPGIKPERFRLEFRRRRHFMVAIEFWRF